MGVGIGVALVEFGLSQGGQVVKKIWFLLVTAALMGCSTVPVTEQDAARIPLERIYQPDLVGSARPGEAQVTFLRDKGHVGSACSHTIFVNNQKAFAVRPGEGVSLRLPPGSYFFRLESGAGLCPDIATSQDAELKAGSDVAYRILLPSDGSLRLTRVR